MPGRVGGRCRGGAETVGGGVEVPPGLCGVTSPEVVKFEYSLVGPDLPGKYYLGVENQSVNVIRAACSTLVMAECSALGISMDDPILTDCAFSILSPVKVCATGFVVFVRKKLCPRYMFCVINVSP